jgi:LruC domain-containing protein
MKNPCLIPLCIAAIALSAMVPASAYEVDATGIKWKYYNGTSTGDTTTSRAYTDSGLIPSGTMSGSSFYSSSFNTLAKPLTAPQTLNSLDSQISYTLQEKRHIDKSSIVLTNDDQTNIKIDAGKTAEVWVTFMNEGAGFENSVGFFTYDLQSVPTRNADGSNTLTSEQIFFPRASTSFPLPRSTTTGTTVYLGQFNGGTNGLGIGFLVVANGWSGTGRSVTPAIPGVKSGQDKSWIYYSLKALNPECVGKDAKTCTLDQHTILLNDGTVTGSDNVVYQRLVLGIEDYKRTEAGCDHDFNDVLLAVHMTPSSSIGNLTSFPPLISSTDPDTDGDGIKDSADEFPNDPAKAFSRYYPGSSTWGTLAYEDLWPALGDYDLNDVVVRYKSREILNAARSVTALELDLRLDARGGGLSNGFAISLPGILASNIASVVLTKEGVAVTDTVQLAGVTGEQNGVVFEIFSNATDLMPADNSGACAVTGYRNTGQNCPVQAFVNYKLSVAFTTALATFPSAPYDAFIFNSNGSATAKGLEVHLPGKQPTSRADRSLFGTQDDRSVLGTTATYKSANGLPWALDIPAEWAYPYEFMDVVNVYPNIVPWAVSGGVSNKNWYELSADNVSKTFRNGR